MVVMLITVGGALLALLVFGYLGFRPVPGQRTREMESRPKLYEWNTQHPLEVDVFRTGDVFTQVAHSTAYVNMTVDDSPDSSFQISSPEAVKYVQEYD